MRRTLLSSAAGIVFLAGAAHAQAVVNLWPGAAPGSEQQAFTFVIDASASPHPLTGRIMVFPSAQALKAKADWGQRIGSTFIQHRNILVWLDTDLDGQTAARFRKAINGMR